MSSLDAHLGLLLHDAVGYLSDRLVHLVLRERKVVHVAQIHLRARQGHSVCLLHSLVPGVLTQHAWLGSLALDWVWRRHRVVVVVFWLLCLPVDLTGGVVLLRTHVGIVAVLSTVEAKHSLMPNELGDLGQVFGGNSFLLTVGRLVTLFAAGVADDVLLLPVASSKATLDVLGRLVVFRIREVGQLLQTRLLVKNHRLDVSHFANGSKWTKTSQIVRTQLRFNELVKVKRFLVLHHHVKLKQLDFGMV